MYSQNLLPLLLRNYVGLEHVREPPLFCKMSDTLYVGFEMNGLEVASKCELVSLPFPPLHFGRGHDAGFGSGGVSIDDVCDIIRSFDTLPL